MAIAYVYDQIFLVCTNDNKNNDFIVTFEIFLCENLKQMNCTRRPAQHLEPQQLEALVHHQQRQHVPDEDDNGLFQPWSQQHADIPNICDQKVRFKEKINLP